MSNTGKLATTKFNFHLRKLKSDGLVLQYEEKRYGLTDVGKRSMDVLRRLESP